MTHPVPRKLVYPSLAAVMLLLAGNPARAGFVSGTFTGVSPNVVVEIKDVSLGIDESVYAGLNNIAVTSSDSGFSGTVGVFCVDLQRESNGNPTTFQVSSLTSTPLGYPMTSTQASWLSALWGQDHSKLSTAVDFAAFQIAAWEIVAETPGTTLKNLNVYSGNFSVVASPDDTTSPAGQAAAEAQSFLNNLNPGGPSADLVGLTTDANQNFVTASPVPAPASGVLLGMGGVLLASAGYIRQRKGKNIR
jgi:hypothetical protein